jgi:hypothetical protein
VVKWWLIEFLEFSCVVDRVFSRPEAVQSRRMAAIRARERGRDGARDKRERPGRPP